MVRVGEGAGHYTGPSILIHQIERTMSKMLPDGFEKAQWWTVPLKNH